MGIISLGIGSPTPNMTYLLTGGLLIGPSTEAAMLDWTLSDAATHNWTISDAVAHIWTLSDASKG